jgi:hypothetical protein
MGRIGSQIAKKRFAFSLLFVDELDGVVEPDICAISRILLRFAVVKVRVIKIVSPSHVVCVCKGCSRIDQTVKVGGLKDVIPQGANSLTGVIICKQEQDVGTSYFSIFTLLGGRSLARSRENNNQRT